MIVDRLDLTPAEIERAFGWRLTPEGACKDDRCVPLDGPADLRGLADALGMPIVHDARGLFSVGPESGGRTLASARMPPLALPDLDGTPFDLASLRGSKVLLVAWASW